MKSDSLLVYPGIIDAQGAAKFEFPKEEVDRRKVESWAPPRTLQGFTPHRRVADHLTATGADLKDQRAKGVVAAAVHPADALMPGRGALLLLRKGAIRPEQLVVLPVLGPSLSFRAGQGVYPSTLFGVMAFLRQAFEDAARQQQIEAAHARDPRGIPAPVWDADLDVLRELVSGRTPAFFTASSSEDIRRVLDLAQQHRFQPVIVGGGEAWKLAELLKARNVPVLVSLDFPKPKRWKPEEKKEKQEPKEPVQPTPTKPPARPTPVPAPPAAGPDVAAPDAGESAATGQQEPRSLDAAELREKQELEDLYSNAARLARAGVRFALTSGGGKADIREGVRKAMEYGLPETDAVRAVTATPAALLGAPHLARIEPGLPATFVVASGPLFDKNTRIAYTFVEGELERGAEPKKDAKKEGAESTPAVSLSGSWDLEVVIEGQTFPAKMSITQTGAAFEGTVEAPVGTGRVRDGTVAGSTVTFVIVMETGGETMDIKFTGEVSGDSASGTGSGPMGSLSWSARRTSGPGRGAP